jgi:hypothetical protein
VSKIWGWNVILFGQNESLVKSIQLHTSSDIERRGAKFCIPIFVHYVHFYCIYSCNGGAMHGQQQCCQMVYFQTKHANLGKFWSVCQWKLLVKFMDISSILWPFGIFCGHFGIFSRFGMLYLHTKENLSTLVSKCLIFGCEQFRRSILLKK